MATTTSSTVSTKRKRNEVSYVVEDYYEGLGVGESHDDYESNNDESDDDTTSGSCKVKNQAKRAKLAGNRNMKKNKKDQKPFRFLDLPAELRDEIYDWALFDPEGIDLGSTTKGYRRTVTRNSHSSVIQSHHRGVDHVMTCGVRKLIPNLLAVNKQIHQEASTILYRQEITLQDTTALHTFVTQIGPQNRQLLRNIAIRGWGLGRGVYKANNVAAFSVLATCTNLKTVFIGCKTGWHSTPILLARQIFRDSHYFLEAIGAAHGKYDASLEILQLCDENFEMDGSRYRYAPRSSSVGYQSKQREEFDAELRKLLKRR